MTEDAEYVLVSKAELRGLAKKKGRAQANHLLPLLKRAKTREELVDIALDAAGEAQGMFGRNRARAVIEALAE